MGLRERNAAQTREVILESALDLFLAQGFDATRMEEVAARAEVGTSTLYRYFSTKDRLLTEPLALHGQMAAELRRRPPSESLDLALGHALRALVTTPRPDTDRLNLLLEVLATAPGPQARLLEDAAQERLLLAEAIAGRLGRSPGDPFCDVTARLAMSVLELISPGFRDSDASQTPSDNASAAAQAVDYLRGILDLLHRDPPVLPRL